MISISGEGSDATATFPEAFAPSSLLNGELSALLALHHAPFLAGGGVESPEFVASVVPAGAAQEGDPGAVGGDGEGARNAHRESQGPGVEAREGGGGRCAHPGRLATLLH